MPRIYLSPPDVGPKEREALLAALDSGWIAPLGPAVDEFEARLAEATGRPYACALSSGTAALHLALVIGGVGAGDRVLVSTLTFVATANAVTYVGATPVFIDSEPASWNLDPELLTKELDRSARVGELPKAVIAVDLYGQCADYKRITEACKRHGVLLISDAAESLGASYRGRPAGSFGDMAILSFNGNKIITTSGGGALLTSNADWDRQARHLSTQAREPAAHYEHTTRGYNYRLSNLLAAVGCAQLEKLAVKVERRRAHNVEYRKALEGLDQVQFMPEIAGGDSTFWLTALCVGAAGDTSIRDRVIQALTDKEIEARPVWKPMHQQPLFSGAASVLNGCADHLFANGLCLPSGSSLSPIDRDEIAASVKSTLTQVRA